MKQLLEVKDDLEMIKSSLLVMQSACDNYDGFNPQALALQIDILLYYMNHKMSYLSIEQ